MAIRRDPPLVGLPQNVSYLTNTGRGIDADEESLHVIERLPEGVVTERINAEQSIRTSQPTGRIVISDISMTFEADRKKASTVQAINNVNLIVEPGEFVTILGPSGCGKSTLLHIAGGFTPATSGSVTIDGNLVSGPRRECGMIFQQPTLFPWKTIVKNVAWSYEVAKVERREARKRAMELLRLVELEDFAEAYPSELSGGMRQRAAIARTLALTPNVLLMDEPFGALDALTREAMQEELNKIWERSKLTVLFVTHDIDEAVFLGDRVVVMSSRPGTIREDVKIDIPRPRSAEVKGSPEAQAYHRHFWGLLRDEASRLNG